MSKLRVQSFAISIDGFSAGPRQDLENPLGVRGPELMEWFFNTRMWREMHKMEGGESGKAILPLKPSISKFYTSLVDPDEDVVMPPPKEKARPSKEQIERVRKWIEEGADWPDGIEFKK